MPVTFLNSQMLWGLLLVLIPILIHLWNKSRYQVEPFGAMLFLRQALKARARAIRIREWTLLLTRILFFLLLALALARPAFKGETASPADADAPVSYAVILDGSYSMRYSENNSQVFRKARQSLLRLIEEMRPHDNMILIRAENKARLLVPELTYDKAELTRVLKQQTPGLTSSNIPRAIEQAFYALEKSKLGRRRILLLTDNQEHSWNIHRQKDWEQLHNYYRILPFKPSLYSLNCRSVKTPPNIAPLELSARAPLLDIYRPAAFTAEIANYSNSPRQTSVTFTVDGEMMETRPVRLEPGVTTLDFQHRFASSGSHYVGIECGNDALPFDNTLFRAVHVLEHAPILLLEGRRSQNILKSEGGVFKLALESPRLQEKDNGLFVIDKINYTAMETLSFNDLQAYKTVVLANIARISQRFIFSLEQYVEQGGGLFIAVGDQMQPDEYRKLFKDDKGLLPAFPVKRIDYENQLFQPVFSAGPGNQILSLFDLSEPRILKEVKIGHYWKCRPGKRARVLATLGEDPFLLLRPYGKGRVILWTTSLNASWNNFPYTQNYLPLIRNLSLYLCSNIAPSILIHQGQPLLYSTNRPETGSPVAKKILTKSWTEDAKPSASLTLPDGTKKNLPLTPDGDDWIGQSNATSLPGLYTVRAPGLAPRYFAVRRPPEEASLQSLKKEDAAELLQKTFPIRFSDSYRALQQQMEEDAGGIREWRTHLIWGLIALFCLELFISQKFSR